MSRTYMPKPIDTRSIHLTKELQELGELLARNTHENFARMRMDSGWIYGPVRDDQKRWNPTLVPYEELPEEEKEYDRRTSSETLKVLIALGYRIEKAK